MTKPVDIYEASRTIESYVTALLAGNAEDQSLGKTGIGSRLMAISSDPAEQDAAHHPDVWRYLRTPVHSSRPGPRPDGDTDTGHPYWQ